jgi:hypothetical protein
MKRVGKKTVIFTQLIDEHPLEYAHWGMVILFWDKVNQEHYDRHKHLFVRTFGDGSYSPNELTVEIY